jgi:hypothetical protein
VWELEVWLTVLALVPVPVPVPVVVVVIAALAIFILKSGALHLRRWPLPSPILPPPPAPLLLLLLPLLPPSPRFPSGGLVVLTIISAPGCILLLLIGSLPRLGLSVGVCGEDFELVEVEVQVAVAVAGLMSMIVLALASGL